jgi:hypothetical protein
MAMCRELLERHPREIQIHSLRMEESEKAREELAPFAGSTLISASAGDVFGLIQGGTRRERIRAQLGRLDGEDLQTFVLYDLLTRSNPDVVIDCVNTATGIAYRDIFGAAERVLGQLEGASLAEGEVETLLEALYMPRLIRHIQVLYNGMIDGGTRVYVKIGTTGTGGMGLNIPYTHSEEKPSRTLLSKSAMAGAQSMLLFLMGRTPGAPITKEIKPAAAIGWKKIGYGPIVRGGRAIRMVDATPQPIGARFSTEDPNAAPERDEEFHNVFIDIEGGNTGHDIVNALDSAVLGPTYRAGILRHWAIDRMTALEKEHGAHSVAFEMLGPPKNSKLLFEAHLLRAAFKSMSAVREATPEQV